MRPELRRVLAVVGILPVLALAGCGGSSGGSQPTSSETPAAQPSEQDTDAAGAGLPCTGLLSPASSQAAIPANLPAPAGTVFYATAKQGATKVYFGYVRGDDVRATRDSIKGQLTTAGYHIEGTDQEDNTEAEAEFGGPHGGRLQVIHYCTDYLRLRYILEH